MQNYVQKLKQIVKNILQKVKLMQELEVLNIKNGTKEWLDFRKNGIGGSDAAAILGLNPWKTNIELWEEKTGLVEPKPVTNLIAIEYGIKAEKPLIDLFKLDYPEYIVKPCKDIIYKRGFLFANLDGELIERQGAKRKGVLEIKTSEIFASMSKEKWTNGVPQNYYIQILHYLITTGYSFAILKAHLRCADNDGKVYIRQKHYFFEREKRFEDMRYLYEKEKEFWGYVERRQCPPCVLPRI